MIYTVQRLNYRKTPYKPLLDSRFEVGCEVWTCGNIYKLSDVVLGKYFLICRQDKGLHGEVYKVNPDRNFELCMSHFTEVGRVANSTYKILERDFVNESLKFILKEELSVGEKRYITINSKLNDE